MTAPDAHNRSTPLGAPTTAREADALESWLESITTPCHVRRGDPGWSPAPSPNGTMHADLSLKESAAKAHAMIANAEHQTGPDVPVDAIWEKIMASTTIPTVAVPAPHVTRRVAERVSAPASSPRTRPIPAWLSGSHWAISALMLAVVVVGIVALYNSFAGTPESPGNDPATNPGIAMASPGSPASSTDSAWLQPISPDECDVAETRELEEVGAITQNPEGNVPREYLPVTDVDPSVAEEVARAERAWESCFTSGLPQGRQALETLRYLTEIVRFDVLAPPNPETHDDWVALNEAMRKAFLDPGIESYLVESDVLPNYECDTGYPDIGLSDEVSYQVIQPRHLVRLPDGRIGGPVSSLVGPGFVQCLEESPPPFGDDQQFTSVQIYAEDPTRGGRWALDEQFWICVTGCQAHYEEVGANVREWLATPAPDRAASTPAAAIADAALLQPLGLDECDVEARTLDETAALMQDPGETMSRLYDPVRPLSDALALEISNANRMFQSCRITGETGQWRAMVSPRLIFEGIGSWQVDTIARNSATYEEYVANHRALSEMLLTDATNDYTVKSTQTTSLDMFDVYGGGLWSPVMLPEDIVRFRDGRIGGPESQLLPANYEELLEASQEAGTPSSTPYGFEMVGYPIYARDPTQDGRWVLDETLVLCASGCDAYYAQAEEHYQSSVLSGILPATPVATPAASTPTTPTADAAALQPIYPEECVVKPLSDEEISAIIREPGGETEQSYAPTGPVDDALAQEIAGADRAWQSCFVFGSAGERAALQSPRLTREGPGADSRALLTIEDEIAYLAQFDARRELSETMLTGDWRDFYIESDLFAEGTPPDLQIPGFIPTVPIPDQAIHLADGRIAIPLARLDPPSIYPHALADMDDIPYWFIPVHVLARDQTQHSRWVIDETFTLCMGDCDLARARIVEEIDYLEGLVTTPNAATPPPVTPDATPIATPRTSGEREHG
ncbi:MAG: hypothetical protein H0V37_06250 [Chloroflexia bacterium]|nr:hypothetical protein [Chloroflexia bacterium]